MENDNSVVVSIDAGWFDQLLTEIDLNKQYTELLADDYKGRSAEDYAIAMNMKARDDRVKTRLMLCSTNEGYAVIDKADYQDILFILLENSITRPHFLFDEEVQYE